MGAEAGKSIAAGQVGADASKAAEAATDTAQATDHAETKVVTSLDRDQLIAQTKSSRGLRPDLNQKWFNNEGRLLYPDNDGALGDWQTVTLKRGQVTDRYGLNAGKYLSPEGTSFEQRSLASDPNPAITDYHQFEVLQDFDVSRSQVAPFYDQPGLGVQYRTSPSVESLIDSGFLREVKQK